MKFRQLLPRVIISAIAIVVGVAICFVGLLYVQQDQLIFVRQPAPVFAPQDAALTISEVNISGHDGLSLRGWLARPAATDQERLPLLIYFGGNAEEVSHMAGTVSHFPEWSLLAVNYRGYGGNGGEPSERALFADALAVYDWAATRADVLPNQIVAMGRSLGSGVAVFLASQRSLSRVVLVTPFDSLRAVAQHHYPYMPVSLLLKHPFDSLAHAERISSPILIIAARRDTIVPPVHARTLFEQWKGPKTWWEFTESGHNDLDADPGYLATIAAFLAERESQ